MDNEETILKDKFQTLALNNIKSNDSSITFNTYCENNNYRLAYLVLSEHMEKEGLKFNSDEEKTNENFYWLFVN